MGNVCQNIEYINNTDEIEAGEDEFQFKKTVIVPYKYFRLLLKMKNLAVFKINQMII